MAPDEEKTQKQKDAGISSLLGGRLNILGVPLDLGELLDSPGAVQEKLTQLRELLKAAGGKESMSDVDWQAGGATVSGFIRTHGVLGEEEYHVGTMGRPGGKRPAAARPAAGRPAAGRNKQPAPTPESAPTEPPLDVFDDPTEIRILADVPGTDLEDIELTLKDNVLLLATKAAARRAYRCQVPLPAEVDFDHRKAVCRNGVLELVLPKVKSQA